MARVALQVCLLMLATKASALIVGQTRVRLPLLQQTKVTAPDCKLLVRSALASTGCAGVLTLHAPAAFAAEIEGVPDDSVVVGFALFLLVCIGLLNLSLGDIAADEAQLPSSVNLINKNRQRRSTFIKGGKDSGMPPM